MDSKSKPTGYNDTSLVYAIAMFETVVYFKMNVILIC